VSPGHRRRRTSLRRTQLEATRSQPPRYRAFIERCVILDITGSTAEIYATVRQQLKSSGSPIPDADIWIAAAALKHQLPLASYDVHFNHVEGLKVIS
jgi:predicted nucleic acid-binding protein